MVVLGLLVEVLEGPPREVLAEEVEGSPREVLEEELEGPPVRRALASALALASAIALPRAISSSVQRRAFNRASAPARAMALKASCLVAANQMLL